MFTQLVSYAITTGLGSKKFIKFEMKKGRSIEIALKSGEGGMGILLEGILNIQCFCHTADKIQ